MKAGFKKDKDATIDSDMYKEHAEIQNVLLTINKLKTQKLKKNRTPQAQEVLNDAMTDLRNILNKPK